MNYNNDHKSSHNHYHRSYDDRYKETFAEKEIIIDIPEAAITTVKPKHKKRSFLKFMAYFLLLAFVSGATFGAGYFSATQIAVNRYQAQQADNGGIVATSFNSNNHIATPEQNAINVTQVQPIVTTIEGTSTIATVALEVSPSIVTIASYSESTPGGFFGESSYYGGTGSGIAFRIIDDELLVVTNYHVIEGANDLEVIFHDGSKVNAKPIGYDSRTDIAVLSLPLEEVESLLGAVTLATFGDSDTVKVGETAIAIGNPLGPDYASTVTAGIISALGRDIAIDRNTSQINLIQTDAAINPGNSGGALLNHFGEVIGINSAKYVDESVEGIGFAIPINDATVIIDNILSNPNGSDTAYELSDDRAFLGVQISDITSEIYRATGMRFGAYITGIVSNSGAEEAGLQEGDIIYSINGKQIRNVQGLFNVLDTAKVNDIISIDLLRGDDLLSVKAKLYSYKTVMDQQ